MADIAKVITIIGNSPESFAEAAQVAVQRLRRRCVGSRAPTSSDEREVEGDQITMYRTTVNIAFAVERS